MNTNPNTTEAGPNRPFSRIRHGNLTVSIWRNQGEYGFMYASHLQRSYRDSDGVWQNTTSLNERDLLNAAKLLDWADTQIQRYKVTDRKEAAAATDQNAPPTVKAKAAPSNNTVSSPPNNGQVTVTLPDGSTVDMAPDVAAIFMAAQAQAAQDAGTVAAAASGSEYDEKL